MTQLFKKSKKVLKVLSEVIGTFCDDKKKAAYWHFLGMNKHTLVPNLVSLPVSHVVDKVREKKNIPRVHEVVLIVAFGKN